MNEIMMSGSWTAATIRYDTPTIRPMIRTWAPSAIANAHLFRSPGFAVLLSSIVSNIACSSAVRF
jgi:hypothetical protein